MTRDEAVQLITNWNECTNSEYSTSRQKSDELAAELKSVIAWIDSTLAPFRAAIAMLGNEQAMAAFETAGFVIVPRAPTKEMLEAAGDEALDENAAGVWREMVKAAPKFV